MAYLEKISRVFASKTTGPEDSTVQSDTSVAFQPKASDNKEYEAGYQGETCDTNDHAEENPDKEAQAGVQKIEAVTLTWSKASLATVLIL
jgi:hypothetical protein